MTKEKIIKLSLDQNGVATILINRPEVHNAFDDKLIFQLTELLYKIDKDPKVLLMLLKGEGKSFSAGADLNWMKRMADYSWDENFQDSLALASLMSTISNLNKPIIAVVQGAAFGGGLGLVAACDFAIASDKAKFCLSEVKLGLVPAVISPYVVKAIGARNSKRFFLTGEVFDAHKAFELGLVSEVVIHENLEQTVREVTRQITSNGPIAIGEAKKLVNKVSSGEINEEMIRETAAKIADLRASPEGQEGVTAFLEKRSPKWPEQSSNVDDLADTENGVSEDDDSENDSEVKNDDV